MSERRLACLAVAAVLLAGSCSQSADPFATSLPGEAATIGPAGGRADLSGGVVVESFAGTFDSEASISLTAGGSAPLPPGATPVGEAVTLTAVPVPSAPLVVGLSIPEGAPAENLAILHTGDAGEQQVLGGWTEGSTFFAVTPGLSEFRLVEYGFPAALAALAEPAPEEPLIPIGPAGQGARWAGSGFGVEFDALVRGTADRPVPRFARVVGPGEVAVGQTASFAAVDFACFHGQFAEYAWEILGTGLAIAESGEAGRTVVEGTAVGRAVISVEAHDPLSGATAFASQRVFVVDEALTITALPLRSLYFEDDPGPEVMAAADGGTPPYSWEWTWGDGAAGTGTGAEVTIEHGPIADDLTLTMTVTDAAGIQATAPTAVRGLPGRRGDAVAMLAGPFTGAVGEELVYRILLWEAADEYSLPPQALLQGAAGEARVDGEVVRVTFQEPGLGLIILADNDPGALPENQAHLAATGVRVTGEAPEAEARFVEAAGQATAGAPAGFRLEARGGVVANLALGSTYAVEVDWGDGEVTPGAITATSALDWSAAELEHTWVEAGTFTVTATVTTPDGLVARATLEIEVVGEQRAAGEFQIVEVEGLEVLANEVVLLIEGGTITFDKWQFHSRYQVMTFEIGEGGATVAVPTDCTADARIRLRAADLTLNPENGRIRGTVNIRDMSDMTGPECPFGGGSRDVVRRGEATGTFREGVLELTLSFPTIPEAYETTLQIKAVTG